MTEAGSRQGAQINMPPRTDSSPIVERAERFIKRNVVPTTFTRLSCGDGRYVTPEGQPQGLRIFGEDMGALAAYWQAGKEAQLFSSGNMAQDIGRCVREYVAAKTTVLNSMGVTGPDASRLYLHTDTHSEHTHAYGCGHMKNLAGAAGSYADKYGTSDKELQALFTYVMDKKNNIDHKVTTLQGDHKEAAVILVKGADGKIPEFSVRSSDETGEMYFVVDVDRVQYYFNRLSTTFPTAKVSEQALMKAYSQHQGVTAGLLAANYPVLTAFIGDTPEDVRIEVGNPITPTPKVQ